LFSKFFHAHDPEGGLGRWGECLIREGSTTERCEDVRCASVNCSSTQWLAVVHS